MQGSIFFIIFIFSIALNLIFILCKFRKISSVLHYLLFIFGYVLVSIIPCSKTRVIAYLAQQLFILRRICQKKKYRLTKAEKLTLVTFGRKIKNKIQYSLIFKPDTLVNWHRRLVKMYWTYGNGCRTGRPRIAEEIENLIIRLAQENDWGYPKIRGELKKLGHKLSETTIKNVLKRYGIPISAKRKSSTTWREFIRHYKELMLSSDFFTVDTGLFKRFYVLMFKELRSRKILFAACTENPTGDWTAQQARQLAWKIQDGDIKANYLIRDKDDKYTKCFDNIFKTEGIKIIKTSDDAPLQNSYMERSIRSIREECLDKIIILNQTHLSTVLQEFINYFNTARPHQGIDNQIPEKYGKPYTVESTGKVLCRNILGGIMKDYYRAPLTAGA